MIKILALVIFMCNFNPADFQGMLDINADEMFKSIIGRDALEMRKELDTRTIKKEVKDYYVAKKEMARTSTTTQLMPEMIATPHPSYQTPNVSIEEMRLKLKKIEISRLLQDNSSFMPNFAAGSDDPALITRQYDQIVAARRSIPQDSETNQPVRRVIYWDEDDPQLIRSEKTKVFSIMEQFIYSIRYKLPEMELFRKKYRNHVRYKIGFCFATLRNIRQHQKMLHTTLVTYYKYLTNIVIHMKLYEKIVKLDVDIKDLVKYIRFLNYQMKLLYKPDYYDDSPEKTEIPDMKVLMKYKQGR